MLDPPDDGPRDRDELDADDGQHELDTPGSARSELLAQVSRAAGTFCRRLETWMRSRPHVTQAELAELVRANLLIQTLCDLIELLQLLDEWFGEE